MLRVASHPIDHKPKNVYADQESIITRFRFLWYVYFLKLNNGDIYVGSTNDLKRRFASHQSGQVVSTRKFLPAVLKCYLAVETKEKARELEEYFKSGSGKALAMKRFWS